MKRRVKSWLGAVIFGSGLYRVLFRGRAVVVVFHRVREDLAGNWVSCTTTEFRAYCDFFRRYFHVISLSELLRKMDAGEDLSRCLAISFDDGYRDNREIAAPELRQRALPACFFIATDLIGSDVIPWWDERQGVRTEWMSWDDVRALRDEGFELGAHTCNHADLGKVHGEEARHEIVASRERLALELGTEVSLFSYPYGRPDQITEENREAVRTAGFSCCFSAFGGSIRADDDRFSLLRTPVTPWHLSPLQLGFELALQHR